MIQNTEQYWSVSAALDKEMLDEKHFLGLYKVKKLKHIIRTGSH